MMIIWATNDAHVPNDGIYFIFQRMDDKIMEKQNISVNWS